ncbi:glucose-6-phosphate isomerase [Colwellia psychrerythraea]|uniref:Glucose-6-phosphate isomerase 2 n=1 Tax=Colwellia psychrerythraea (strain 34H / ATCC BAA-681) TaxID=167879 RepID=G6PI2_COLP3|nr:glucose-6-phosphate isomerase [Colwellia psychrerythraea]Q483D3.1 RecName: Full=Glucose-6-phosphate isomerase 2; Short=GPI 2; AltName: Full=Phosphoglucose isomerase 2; Short=PGI 2; AltName: Full=Phosphohexose isomerase 2; Short=PHI 2 [Colwellia psychrerythraea 34H]AAZ25825.1 glucose-6-phosphate isomerase [Colwellia psychrerythraea 34H]
MDIKKLSSLAHCAKTRSIVSLFDQKERANDFSLSTSHLYLDYSKQNITDVELEQLIEIAEDVGLSESITGQFNGDKINNTEGRSVLHTILRAPQVIKQQILGDTLANEVEAAELQMAKVVNDVQKGILTSHTGQRFTDVLAIGIGGSYYGVKVSLSALEHYRDLALSVHVIANVDGGALEEKLKTLNFETTLVVVISKTFTTQETMLNAKAVKQWMLSCASVKDLELNNVPLIIEKQWFAVSSNIEAAKEFGINIKHILPMWDWVGGRFSIWSTVGLPLALAIGNDNFNKLKQGAYEMDVHFKSTDFKNNMPVIMALLGIWNRNALEYPTLAILPYAHSLRALPGYLQQTDMESNGKSVSKSGDKLSWLTAPVVFGQEGTNGQHAFMQLMHQSDDIIPTDFIVALKGRSQYTENHKVLVANCFAQSEALMQGKTLTQVESELEMSALSTAEISLIAPHKTMKGNTPSNTLVMDLLTPETIGSLLALYEHKIFVQGVLWQVNSFDQWGVELGKQLGTRILSAIDGAEDDLLSASSQSLIARFRARSNVTPSV